MGRWSYSTYKSLLLLPLILETTQSNMKTLDSELYIGELHKGAMFRSTTTFRIFEEKVEESHKPPGCWMGWTKKLLSRATFEPLTACRLESRYLQKKLKRYFWIWQKRKSRICSLFRDELWGFWWLLRVYIFFMFSKMEGKTRFQRPPSSKGGWKYRFPFPNVLQRFRRAPKAEVDRVFLRTFGAFYLAVDNHDWQAEGSWRRSSSLRYRHMDNGT